MTELDDEKPRAELPPKLKQALNDLTILQPFWATLVLHMELEEKPTSFWTDLGMKTATFATDGRKIYYNRKFSESLSRGVNMMVLAHEAAHPMFMHLTRISVRRPGRSEFYGFRNGKPMFYDPALWNIAGDFVINLALRDCGFELWNPQTWAEAQTGKKSGCLCDPQFTGMTTEQVYNIIEKQQKQNGGGGSNVPQDGITGQDIMAPAEGLSEDQIKEIVSKAATIAKSQGKLPASLENLIKECTEPVYPVYSLLERFIDSNIRDEDYSWHQPNRRYLPYGIIMPTPWSEKISDVTVVYDTSGSVPDEDLQMFHKIAGEILRKLGPKLVRIIQCDAGVHRVDEFRERSEWKTEIKCTGRGGTSFIPPFEWLKEKSITPSCLVYLTDMEGSFPEFAPNYPVMWVATTDHKAPFGFTVQLKS